MARRRLVGSTVAIYRRWQSYLHRIFRERINDSDRIKHATLQQSESPETNLFALLELIFAGTKQGDSTELARRLLERIVQDLVESDEEDGFWQLLHSTAEAAGVPTLQFTEHGIVESPQEAARRVVSHLGATEQEQLRETFETFLFFCPTKNKWTPICMVDSQEELERTSSRRAVHTDYHPERRRSRRPLQKARSGDPTPPKLGDLFPEE